LPQQLVQQILVVEVVVEHNLIKQEQQAVQESLS
jgi:hypothetical protein